jgi:hypothetical protein
MSPSKQTSKLTEHFVTLFDSHFLPQGLALAQSLRTHCAQAQLWVICMDVAVEGILAALKVPGLKTISLRDVENPRLRKARADRTEREYCWTVTAFTFDAVFDRCPEAARVTYVDADLFFFGSPLPLFDELTSSGASILITEHGFDPAYDKSDLVGRFCVQFLVMDRSKRAEETRRWWQDRVIEWCYDRREPGRFGDQKYLDEWPRLFGDRLRVLQRRELALAPWNVRMESERSAVRPAFYHFHSFRIVSRRRARTVEAGYAIPIAAQGLYKEYTDVVSRVISRLEREGIRVPTLPLPWRPFNSLRHMIKLALGRADSFVAIRREA